MLPIFLSSVLGYLPIPLLLTFSVQQGGTMDTRLGGTSIPPASLFVIPVVFQMVILVAYDRAAVPRLRRATGYAGGITPLQRIGVGFASSVVALAAAAAVEARRREDVGVLAGAAVLPAGRDGRHLLRRPARVLLQRGLRRHEVHRRRRVLLRPRRRVVARELPHPGGQPRHRAPRWVAGRRQPRRRPPRSLLLAARALRARILGALRVLRVELHLQARSEDAVDDGG
ncbi:protein NRT1/ PTR FAMILY 4.3-like [Panicum miliaceum]|uniref:Protein NRT1/ PTR FAMILY 4.3-like n=1 Tax=Panicum miliaceum TaxID=4540 RepID=A0A3L6RCQ8_PANMI|nr:protein NRT1/ PTR FAMILY 4.3-like [Panicum miliaceum]